jgi:Caspase domain
MSAKFNTALLGAILGSYLLAAPASAAGPAHVALVIGNGTYATLPQLPACLQSAHAVAAALHGAGFDVVEREDTSSGAMDAAVGEFVTKLTQAPDAAAVIYVCSYGTEYNNRPFMLPVSANITRPADVLTQGVLAKSLIDALRRGNAGPTLVAIDVVAAPIPGAPLAVGLNAAVQNLPDRTSLIVAGDIRQSNAPSILATALVEQFKNPELQTSDLLAALQQALAMRAVSAAALHQANTPG